MHGCRQFLQCFHRNFLENSRGCIFRGEWFNDFHRSADLHSLHSAEAAVLVINRQADILVFLQPQEFLSAFRKHPECLIMPGIFNRRAAHEITGTGGQRAGVVGTDIFFDQRKKFSLLNSFTVLLFFIPILCCLLVFLMRHSDVLLSGCINCRSRSFNCLFYIFLPRASHRHRCFTQ